MSTTVRAALGRGLLGTLSPAALDALATRGQILDIPGGRELIRQGDVGGSAYLVVHGRLHMLLEEDGSIRVVGEAGPGELVGEVGLVTGQPRTASVVVVRDSQLLEIGPELFDEVTAGETAATREITQLIVDRLVRRHVKRTDPRVLAVVTDESATASSLPTRLETSLSRLGPEVQIVRAPADEDLPHLVAAAETERRVLLLVNDAGDHDRCRASLRQADVVIPVSDGPSSPAGELVLRELQGRPFRPQVEAVGVSGTRLPPGAFVEGVRRHRVGAGSHDDVDRLARLIYGRGKALVLGSGSARGIAHVGVLQALEDRGVPVDVIGGSSAGAVVAGMWAYGRTPVEMRDDILDFLDRVRWRKDVVVPAVSFLSGRQLSDAIESYFAGALIEDLPVNMFAVSTDLVAGRPVVHDSGPVWRALRASASIPGIFPPVRAGDRLLADGAILDRLPIATMRERNPASEITCVDVSTPQDLAVHRHSPDGRLGRTEALRWSRGNRSSAGIGALMGRIVELTGTTDDMADVTIHPTFDLDTRGGNTALVDAAIRAGYDATSAALERAGDRGLS